jgi:hypothetical protein
MGGANLCQGVGSFDGNRVGLSALRQ